MNPHAWRLTDLDAVPSNGVRVMSTFACGGGSSLGYKRAGCQVVAANDIDPEMAWHYKLNIHPPLYYLCPIRDLVTMDLPRELFELDILDGSPPCSTFSMAGNREKDWGKEKKFREGQATQVLSDLFFDWLDLVERLKPRVAIAENVKGMIHGNAKGYVKLVMARLREIGYRAQLFLVNAADCGVPQRRERVFFCAAREDLEVAPLRLAPTHRWVSAGEATGDLQVLTDEERKDVAPSAGDLEWWPLTACGENYGDAKASRGLKRTCFSHFRLSSAEPSPTVTAASAQLTHWSECRHLTLREFIRLGSFPDDYIAKTPKLGKYLIGMSVPPKMAEVVARAVCEQWLGVGRTFDEVAGGR